MGKVLIDMHRLKHNPYNGLYIFSKELGDCLSTVPHDDLEFFFYLPKALFGFFGDQVKYANHRSIDKFFRFGTSQFDVWHITTTISWYGPFHKKVRTIYTIHDLNFLAENSGVRSKERKLKQIQMRAEKADCIVGISQYALEEAEKYLPIQNKIKKVIYNGCSFKSFPEFDSPRYVSPKPFLFSIGQIMPMKNFHVLPCLLQGNDFELIIAGLEQSDYSQKIYEEAGKFGVADRVHLIGAVTEEEKYWYYQNCTAFLFPSLAEGFGLPVVEAMYCGKPAFLSNKTCLPEIGGTLAFYFDHFNPAYMQETFKMGMQRYQVDNMSEAIKNRAKTFSWRKAAKEYIDLYRTLSQ